MSQQDVAREAARLASSADNRKCHSTRSIPRMAISHGSVARRPPLPPRPLAIEQPQLLVVVDRDPAVQELRIILAQPDATWQVIGGSKVSTGQSGRRGYFITPMGVFLHTDGILDYRALGTFNENHIRGLGLKGMRVWDFGWQTAQKGWRDERDPAEIRLQMHATDPDYLEQRLGPPGVGGLCSGARDDEPVPRYARRARRRL